MPTDLTPERGRGGVMGRRFNQEPAYTANAMTVVAVLCLAMGFFLGRIF